MYLRTFLSLLLVSASINHVVSIKILGIASMPLRSHYMAFHSLFRELANRGHSVTVINNFPEEKPVPNLRFVDISSNLSSTAVFFTPLEFYETFDSTYLHLRNFLQHFVLSPDACETDCENLFTHANAKAHLAEGNKYDVIIAEQFVGDCGLAYVASMFDAPIIGITSHVLLPLTYVRLGLPFDVSSDPFYFSKVGPNPSLYFKVESFLLNFFYNNIGTWMLQRYVYESLDRYVPDHHMDIEAVAKDRIKMVFAYQHFSLTGSRVLSPQVLEIGGIHIGKPKPVPQDVEKFLSNAEHGAIYVSFGSNLKANSMSPAMRQNFLEAFKRIPQKVLWKVENATFPEGYDNVYARSWFPQLDILCHPKVVAFVTHGGMLSLSETTHCGKPVLAIPFFGDQLSNAAAAKTVGLGNVLYFDKINASSLAAAIEELTTEKMQRSAKKVSELWHDRPMNAMDSAIYWTEYVARHKAPPPLPSLHTSWYEKALLDVAMVLILILSVVLYIVIKLLKLVLFVFKSLINKNSGKKNKRE